MSGKKKKSKQRICIVFQETGEHGGKGFQVFLDGHERDLDAISQKEMTPAEFWASRGMMLVINALRQAGVIKTVIPTFPPDGKLQ